MKILCIGHASYDITFPLENFPIENSKNRVEHKVECGGGPASNAAYLLGKWGMDVYFAGLVGKDLYGDKIKSEFDSVNVSKKYLETNDSFETTSSTIIANKNKGSRTVLTYRKDNDKMKLTNFEETFDIILLDGQEFEVSKQALQKYPNAISIIDAGRATDEIIELSKMVTYLVCSKEFAETVTNVIIDFFDTTTISNLYNKMEEMFKNNIVVTLESKGSLYKDNGRLQIMPSIKVVAVDSTGAGDIFHGAFTYGLANNFEYKKVIAMANIAGGLSVTKIGGRYSMPDLPKVEEIYEQFR